MNDAPAPATETAQAAVGGDPATPAAAAAPTLAPPPVRTAPRWLAGLGLLVAALALALSALLWQKVNGMQEQLARQSADAGSAAIEARTLARQALDQARDTNARQAVMDAKLAEVALQRAQVEELVQSLSRSRDENMVVDIESAVRLALQQAQLTGSPEPLLSALKAADQRLARAAQPRLASVQRAIARDVERIRSANLTDTPALLIRLDELVRLADDLPLANAVPRSTGAPGGPAPAPGANASWWQRTLATVLGEVRGLVRVARVQNPEAALLSPEQSFFLRENLKLRLLNARLSLLARQLPVARADLDAAANMVKTYFDPASRRTQAVANLLQQVQGQLRAAELPRVDDPLAALATAAAGK
ncbi:uroporphyrinogen-III C-methyltransferase [Tibeticola sp.]|uniref:uroporphyrinogen-III C-methyltransferase n=1 Tax=Tibeticola sp. TaxID=2005368 RepID=UPI0025D9E3F8|nr:uroporphyrinogen-III C-methyltransferase [Tibeticola sp.]